MYECECGEIFDLDGCEDCSNPEDHCGNCTGGNEYPVINQNATTPTWRLPDAD